MRCGHTHPYYTYRKNTVEEEENKSFAWPNMGKSDFKKEKGRKNPVAQNTENPN